MGQLHDHAALVGLSNTNESIFRSFFVAQLRRAFREAECQTEWHTVDLLAQTEGCNALVEFKYYIVRRTKNIDGTQGNRKGGAGSSNEKEFWGCVESLSRRLYEGVTHKWLILVYERECPTRAKGRCSFALSYDGLKAEGKIKSVIEIDHLMDSQLACKVLEIA